MNYVKLQRVVILTVVDTALDVGPRVQASLLAARLQRATPIAARTCNMKSVHKRRQHCCISGIDLFGADRGNTLR